MWVRLCQVSETNRHIAEGSSGLIDHVLIKLLFNWVLVREDAIVLVADREVVLVSLYLVVPLEVLSLLLVHVR